MENYKSTVGLELSTPLPCPSRHWLCSAFQTPVPPLVIIMRNYNKINVDLCVAAERPAAQMTQRNGVALKTDPRA